RVLEIHPAAAVVVVDLAGPRPARVGPVPQSPFGDPAEDRVEVVFADQERVMLRDDVSGRFPEIQRNAVVGLDDEERPEPSRWRQTENPGQELRRALLVPAPDDGVVQLHAHLTILLPASLAIRPPVAQHAIGNGALGRHRDGEVAWSRDVADQVWAGQRAAWIVNDRGAARSDRQ